jgi:hypothetical protein
LHIRKERIAEGFLKKQCGICGKGIFAAQAKLIVDNSLREAV